MARANDQSGSGTDRPLRGNRLTAHGSHPAAVAKARHAASMTAGRVSPLGGRPMIGAPSMYAVFAARNVAAVPIIVDEEIRLAAAWIGRAIAARGD